MFEVIGVTSGVLAFVGYIPYIRDIQKGRARPERATWLIWSILSAIAFFAQLNKGATQSLWFTALNCLSAVIIFSLSVRKGMGGVVKRDTVGLLFALLGLVLWYLTSNALYALLFTIGVDAVGSVLEIIKTYNDPSSETYLVWILDGIAGGLAAISVGRLDYTLLLYPFYLFLANFAVVIALNLSRKREGKSHKLASR